jgi:glutamate---cysteine ligase / carboxylate-amine ligase
MAQDASESFAYRPAEAANRAGAHRARRANHLSGAALRAAFDRAPSYTVGLEDEIMLLDPETHELAPVAQELLGRLDGDERFKLELPASQLEIVTGVGRDIGALGRALLEARRTLAESAREIALPACAGVHPFSSGSGELNGLERYRSTIEEYGAIARRQLVCALQVHVAVGDADRALAVYNAARSYLPLLAALGANAPFYEGRDTGLASVRPKLAELLPRQGVPPILDTWGQYADAMRWGAASGAFDRPQTWWWELRLHPAFGTLEFRVPDAQQTVADAIAIAAVTQALVAWLGERHDAGERLDAAPTWRIEENRWSACRNGTAGTMADLQTGARRATRDLLLELLETIAPLARRLSGEPATTAIEHAAALVAHGGAARQRSVAAGGDIRAVAASLAERFLHAATG